MSGCRCLFLLAALIAFAQQDSRPYLTITGLPPYGYAGYLSGKIGNADPAAVRVLVHIFVPDAGWYSKPTCAGRLSVVAPDGSFSVNVRTGLLDHLATRFAVYLVPAAFVPPCVEGPSQIPAGIESVYLARATVSRPDPFPKTLHFSGLDWIVKAPPMPVSPGPNQFSDPNAWVDNLGKLHLRVAPCGSGGWCSAEVYTRDALGYGTYATTVESALSTLDPNLVLGLFTWSEDGGYNNREIDIEFSRWGNAADPNNAQYVVQPYTTSGNITRFPFTADSGSVHSFRWYPGLVNFQSTAGLNPSVPPAKQWSYLQQAAIPPPDDARFHLNFYLAKGFTPSFDGQVREIVIGKFEFTGTAPRVSIVSTAAPLPSTASTGTASVTADPACSWSAQAFPEWLHIVSGASGMGNGTVAYSATDNIGTIRTGGIQITSSNCNVAPGAQQVTISQAGMQACTFHLSSSAEIVSTLGSSTLKVWVSRNSPFCAWTASSSSDWITVGQIDPRGEFVILNIAPTVAPESRTGSVNIAGQTFTVSQIGSQQQTGLAFVPVRPCRVADTRPGSGFSGPFGSPTLAGDSERDFPVPWGACGIPPTARAYSLNITAVPSGPLGYLTVWPSGYSRPFVSTLNSLDGRIVANAAIIPAGASGAVKIYASASSDVIIDINGYFTAAGTEGALALYPLSPCRVADTRVASMPEGFGTPAMTLGAWRSFTVPWGPCSVPISAKAYSFNATVVPPNPLGFLTLWPSGSGMPMVSTLNALDGSIVANAAIVPAGASGAVSAFASAATDLVLDINGYFAMPGNPGSLNFYPVTPCRVSDTRLQSGPLGVQPVAGGTARDIPVLLSACGIWPTAKAYSLNFTVVPYGPLGYLTAWPAGFPMPVVSTLNSPKGRILANAAIVPAGAGGAISVYASSTTEVVIDINGYFAP